MFPLLIGVLELIVLELSTPSLLGFPGLHFENLAYNPQKWFLYAVA